MIKILAISGSLRRTSSNTELLKAAALLAGPGVEVALEPAMSELPHFNPDLEGQEPASVVRFRERLRNAEAIIISSPEYAHGVAGALKDALDWVVGSGEFSGKPVALFNASPRATIAHASLAEIIVTMDATLVTDATIAVPLLGRNLAAEAIAADRELAGTIRAALSALVAAVEAQRKRH
ncbi:MAG: NAD(P)H-dependent oxidoreductase [Opitutus sp.]